MKYYVFHRKIKYIKINTIYKSNNYKQIYRDIDKRYLYV